jgi:type IV secretory pathway TraG/TraD family ATPase VirD4
VIPAIEAWPGPVLVSSVKGDVFAATRHERARRGPLTIVDPTKMTGERTASWLPYRNLSTFAEARALARDLCAVAQSATLSGDGEFWMQATARYLAPLLLAAARSGAPLEALLRWIDDDGVAEALAILQRAGDDGAAHVLLQVLGRDARQLHSILTTAEVVLEALVDGAGTGDLVDIDALLSSEGTMYLLASLSGQQRSRALLGALRNEVVARASALAAREGGVLDRPLLIVHDEAAHSSGLEQLSALAATGVGQGITVLTVFQDMGQIAHAHGALASSLVLNHRARVLLAGTIDQASVDLFVALSGERRGEERSESTSRQGKSVSRQTVTRPRLERHLVSSLRRGTAVVLYDALAPFTVQLSTAPAKRRAARVAHAQRRARRRGGVPPRGVER